MKYAKRTTALAGLALATLLSATQVQAAPPQAAPAPTGPNLIRNGSFSDPAVHDASLTYVERHYGNDGDLNGWRVPTGTLHIFSATQTGLNGPQSGNLTGGSKAVIRQSVTLEEGKSYRLSWSDRTENWPGCETKPAADQQYSVTVGAGRAQTITPTSKWLVTDRPITFTATEEDTMVVFASQSSDSAGACGALISKISLRAMSTGGGPS